MSLIFCIFSQLFKKILVTLNFDYSKIQIGTNRYSLLVEKLTLLSVIYKKIN